jgi:hypothetical protein
MENGVLSLEKGDGGESTNGGDIVTINTLVSGEKQVAVFDVLGKKVMDVMVDNELNVATLSPGIYMVRVTQNNSTATKKLIVN